MGDFMIGQADNTATQPSSLQSWFYSRRFRSLSRNNVTISLTYTESEIIGLFTSTHERIISTECIAAAIKKDADNYVGLRMCVSRLRKKFATLSEGEKLLVAVRNRGYCLTQKIEWKVDPKRP
jgi:DNA-binding response OmpR family regulator